MTVKIGIAYFFRSMGMQNKDISDTLRKAAEEALEGFRDWSFTFLDYDYGVEIPNRIDFDEWISNLEDYTDVDTAELDDENRIKLIKRFFPNVGKARLQHLIANPTSITEDESLEWRRSLYEDDQEDADFLILYPLELPSGETGSAIICSYTNIPGGEHDLIDVFSSVEEGEKYLSKHCF